MLKSLCRLLDLLLAFSFLVMTISSPRKWKRYAPALFTAGIVLFLYGRTGHVDINSVDLGVMIEDDFKYQQTIKKNIKETQLGKLVALKAGITIHVGLVLLFIGQDPHASANAKDTVTWILIYSSAPVHFHIMSDSGSTDVIDAIMIRGERQSNCRFTYSVETVDNVFDQLMENLDANVPHLKLDMVKEHVAIQMLPLILPWHYPHLNRLIFVGSHIKFRSDIIELYEHFDRFKSQQVMGLTLTQDAKFATAFAVHRHLQPDSKLGLSPPQGWPGFNTELMLLDLEKMRQSNMIKRYLDLENQFTIVTKYDFKSRQVLPQLDEWLTLVGIEKPELFFTLPCQWNVQQIMDSDAFEHCRIEIKAMTN